MAADTPVALNCAHCGTDFETTKNSHKVSLWRGQTKFYCSPKCVGLAQRVPAVSMTCDHCGKVFSRPASSNKPSKSGLRFCTRKCGSEHHGEQRKQVKAKVPKTSKQCPSCKSCGVACSKTAGGRWRCSACSGSGPVSVGTRTKGDLFASRTSYQSARSAIQKMARTVFFRASPHPSCAAIEASGPCGYTKHVEVCHRRDVADFPDKALISEINDIKNLVGLCPTHHWEFDPQKLNNPLP